MKKVVYLLLVSFVMNVSYVSANSDTYPEVTLDCCVPLDQELKACVDINTEEATLDTPTNLEPEEDFDLALLDLSLEDLEKLEKEDDSWQKNVKIIFSILAGEAKKAKVRLAEMKEKTDKHISEHKKEYTIGTIACSAAALALIIYLLKPKLFPAQAAPNVA